MNHISRHFLQVLETLIALLVTSGYKHRPHMIIIAIVRSIFNNDSNPYYYRSNNNSNNENNTNTLQVRSTSYLFKENYNR